MRSASSLARRRLAATRTDTDRIRRGARAAVVLAFELAAAGALVQVVAAEPGASAAAPSGPRSVQEVAAEPASFRGRPDVRVEGRVAKRPWRVASRDRSAFVLAGKAGGRLLIVPADGVRLQAFRIGTTVSVRGALVLIPDSRRLARRAATRTAVARRAHAPALIKATAVRYESSSPAGT